MRNWPIGLFLGIALYMGYQELGLRPPQTGPEGPLASGARETSKPDSSAASRVLDFFIPAKRKTVRQALGNPPYTVEPLGGTRYLLHLQGLDPKSPSRRVVYQFEFDTARSSLVPRNKEARSLLTEPDSQPSKAPAARPRARP